MALAIQSKALTIVVLLTTPSMSKFLLAINGPGSQKLCTRSTVQMDYTYTCIQLKLTFSVQIIHSQTTIKVRSTKPKGSQQQS
jgi:hypothetical protein